MCLVPVLFTEKFKFWMNLDYSYLLSLQILNNSPKKLTKIVIINENYM